MLSARKPNNCFRRHTGDWSRFSCRYSRVRSSPRNLRAGMRAAGQASPANICTTCAAKRDSKELMLHSAFSKSWAARLAFKEEDGKHFIYGNGCPIAAATANHPEACLLAESLLTELIGSPVKATLHSRTDAILSVRGKITAFAAGIKTSTNPATFVSVINKLNSQIIY